MTNEERLPVTEEDLQKAEDILGTLLNTLGIDADFDIVAQDTVLEVTLDTQDTGIVIGYRGEVLEALQLIMSLSLAKQAGRYIPVSIDIGDYKKKRVEYLQGLAQQVKERVISQQQESTLTNLKPWERRTVHMLLQDDKEVMTESAGEGRDRVLVIKLRK